MGVLSLPSSAQDWRGMPVVEVGQQPGINHANPYLLKGGIVDARLKDNQYDGFSVRDIISFKVKDGNFLSSELRLYLSSAQYPYQKVAVKQAFGQPEISGLECLVGVHKISKVGSSEVAVNYIMIPGHVEVVFKSCKILCFKGLLAAPAV